MSIRNQPARKTWANLWPPPCKNISWIATKTAKNKRSKPNQELNNYVEGAKTSSPQPMPVENANKAIKTMQNKSCIGFEPGSQSTISQSLNPFGTPSLRDWKDGGIPISTLPKISMITSLLEKVISAISFWPASGTSKPKLVSTMLNLSCANSSP